MAKKNILQLLPKILPVKRRGYDNRKLDYKQLEIARILLFGKINGELGDPI